MVKFNKGATHRLSDIETQFVSLVGAGANRQKKFFVVKADEQGLGPGGDCVCVDCGHSVPHKTGTKCTDLKCSECGGAMKRIESKAVPAADASDEDKRKAQETRSKQYGIEALETGANLSYPSGDPTTETLFGDPTNLKYPLGKDDNKPDLGRIRNALARFKQAADTYKTDKSKGVVFARIVTVALEQGIDVGYDPENPIDKLLPSDLKERLEEKDKGGDGSKGEVGKAFKVDLDAWLGSAGNKIGTIESEARLAKALNPTATKESPKSVPKARVDKRNDVHSELRKEASELQAKLRKAEDNLRAEQAKVTRLKSTVGAASSLVTGELGKPAHETTKAAQSYANNTDLALCTEKGRNRNRNR